VPDHLDQPHETWRDPWVEPWRDTPWRPPGEPGLVRDRLTHLVLVDGRLVDVWSEPVVGTTWERHARHFDAERRPAPPPHVPAHQQLLVWLDAVCGGRAAVLGLDVAPLATGEADALVPGADDHPRLHESLGALDLVMARRFDAEVGVALRRALLRVWRDDAPVALGARSPHVLAGGVCWAVGRANGLFKPPGSVTVQQVKELLDRPGTLSAFGQRVRESLHGFRGWSPDVRPPYRAGVPELLPLGHADLLVGSVRAELVRLRDRALSARDEDDFYRAG